MAHIDTEQFIIYKDFKNFTSCFIELNKIEEFDQKHNFIKSTYSGNSINLNYNNTIYNINEFILNKFEEFDWKSNFIEQEYNFNNINLNYNNTIYNINEFILNKIEEFDQKSNFIEQEYDQVLYIYDSKYKTISNNIDSNKSISFQG